MRTTSKTDIVTEALNNIREAVMEMREKAETAREEIECAQFQLADIEHFLKNLPAWLDCVEPEDESNGGIKLDRDHRESEVTA